MLLFLKKLKKGAKNFKKGVDKTAPVWYINWAPVRRTELSAENSRIWAEAKKFEKKCLTKGYQVWYTKNPPSKRRVPCKLNNVNKRSTRKGRETFSSRARLEKALGFKFLWSYELGFNKIDLNSASCLDTILLRVWSWLRMNAGGVLNTCKSNGAYLIEDSSKWF